MSHINPANRPSIFWCALLIGVIALLGLCIGFRT